LRFREKESASDAQQSIFAFFVRKQILMS